MSGGGHPLPGSDEARHNEIPEHLERAKGHGDDAAGRVQPPGDAVTPDGAPYPSADLGRGPDANSEETDMNERRDETRDGAPEGTPREQERSGVAGGGRQLGGGPSPSDMAAPGGSSGTGGYGNADEQQQQARQQTGPSGERTDPDVERGGRGADRGGEMAADQAAHQDRGQSVAEAEQDRD